jgi:uncharacterized membrane protein
MDVTETLWEAVKPHIVTLAAPMGGIMLLIGGIKIIVHPFIKKLKPVIGATIYRVSAIVLGCLWLWIYPMATSHDAYKVPVIIFGGIAYGLFNITLYDKFVLPWLAKRRKEDKK